MSATLAEAKAIAGSSWLELEDEGSTVARYGTREHGDVDEETPGREDVAEARRLAELIRATGAKAYVDVIDEWVTLTIEETR